MGCRARGVCSVCGLFLRCLRVGGGSHKGNGGMHLCCDAGGCGEMRDIAPGGFGVPFVLCVGAGMVGRRTLLSGFGQFTRRAAGCLAAAGIKVRVLLGSRTRSSRDSFHEQFSLLYALAEPNVSP